MTAHALSSDRDKCLEAGMNDHIAKPIMREELFGKLELWLQSSKREPPARPKPVINPEPNPPELTEDLPGLDITRTLRNLGGNRELYVTILGDFYDQSMPLRPLRSKFSSDRATLSWFDKKSMP